MLKPMAGLAKLLLQAALASAILLAAGGVPSASAAPAPVEHFFRRAEISGLVISPGGTHLALLARAANGRKALAVMPLDPLGPARIVAAYGNADVVDARWVNDDRLVYYSVDSDALYDQPGGWGLFAVSRDGSKRRQLIMNDQGSETGTSIASRVLTWQWRLFDTLRDGSADVIVSERRFDGAGDLRALLLSRLDTLTGERRSISTGIPDRARYWVLDPKGQPRAITTEKDGRATVHWRPEGDKPWEPLAEFDMTRNEGFVPWFVDADGTFYVRSRHQRDTAGLYTFDVATRKLAAEPLVSLKGFDFDSALHYDPEAKAILGTHYRMERGGTHWFDKGMRELQATIDAALPDRVNTIQCERCANGRFFVVESSSDRVPGEYFLLDRKTKNLQALGSQRPWLDTGTQALSSFHRVAARDGLSLPVYVTRPFDAAGDGLPAVVLVHGGPWVRGHDLRWGPDSQFLASRGYVVLEVEFRGSTGYGYKHFSAGWKQWGQAMQDDLADAVAWAAREAGVDAGRVCIVGASYGGYAALMGPIRHPDVYRCAVSFAGVSDVDLMYSASWSDLPQEWKHYGMPVLIGDRKADAAQLSEASPLQQAARIRVPVLLAHGGLDQRVPLEHSTRFRSAAERAGVKIEWALYPDEPHGFRQEANQADYWKRVEAFLDRAIGPASAASDSKKQ